MPNEWENEIYIDQNGKEQSFESEDEYNQKIKDWENKDPGFPALLNAAWAWMITKIIIDVWVTNGGVCNDKWLHCYIGCRIAEGTNEDTAKYVAWWKE